MAINLVKNAKDEEIERLKAELEELKSRLTEGEAPPQGATIDKEEADDRDAIQKELDEVESIVIDTLFPNGIKVNPMVQTYLTMKGKTAVDFINESITSFEQYARPFMNTKGDIVFSGKLSELANLAKPLISKISNLIGG